jgi:hypothetical protein
MTNEITLINKSDTDYRELIKKHDGELIQLGLTDQIKPKFSIGDYVETIEEYEGEDCPPEHGTVTNVMGGYAESVYEIDNEVYIYGKWLRKVE